MKTISFLTIAAALGLSLSLPAQQPGPDQERPKDPASRPDIRPESQHREPGRSPDRGPGPQARPGERPPHQHQQAASGHDREAHIREALKHLREAGLGDMAERLEHAIRDRHHDRRGPRQRDVVNDRRMSPSPDDRDVRRPQPPPHRPRWSDDARRDGGAFGAPQRVPYSRRDADRRPDERRDGAAGMEELRSQVQRLTREMEALKNMMKQRMPEPPREQMRRPEEHRITPTDPPREGKPL